MKVISKLLFFILSVLILLSACGAEQQEEVQNESDLSVSSESESPKPEQEEIPGEIYEDENGKFGLKNENGDILVEAAYDSFEKYDSFVALGYVTEEGIERVKIFDFEGNQVGFEYNAVEPAPDYDKKVYKFIGKITEGTMLTVEYDRKGEPFLAEVQNDKSYLLDEFGKPIIDVALESYYAENEWIVGTSEGSRYSFEKRDGEFILESKEDPSEYVDEFGYTHTSYCFDWYGGYFMHGLKAGDTVIFDSVYSGIKVPFNDRIVLCYDSFMQCLECGHCKIVDVENNTLCEKFNYVHYMELDDGTYVGIGAAGGEDAEVVVYDESGKPMPRGFWFIDKDGNILSEMFKLEYLYYGFEISGDVMIFMNDGESVEIPIKDYIIYA